MTGFNGGTFTGTGAYNSTDTSTTHFTDNNDGGSGSYPFFDSLVIGSAASIGATTTLYVYMEGNQASATSVRYDGTFVTNGSTYYVFTGPTADFAVSYSGTGLTMFQTYS